MFGRLRLCLQCFAHPFHDQGDSVKRLRSRLTYANVMSSIAVFLVLGGATAFAAKKIGTSQIKAGAITTGKIKKNAVTTSKIKKDAVTGAKVKESTLGSVPLAETIPPAEPTHLVGAAGEPAFENGSNNLTAPGLKLEPVGFYKDHEGIVHLQGIAEVGKNPGGVASVFTLPAGYRPGVGALLLLEQLSGATAIIAGSSTTLEGISLDGKVFGEEEGAVVLDGITFRAQS